MNQGHIQLFHGPCLHPVGNHLLGIAVLGHDHQAGGVPVQAVDEPDLVVLRLPKAVPGQGIAQGAGGMPLGRVDHQPGRLIDHQDVVILIYDGYIDGLRIEDVFLLLQQETDDVTGKNRPVDGDGRSVETDQLLLLAAADHPAGQIQDPGHHIDDLAALFPLLYGIFQGTGVTLQQCGHGASLTLKMNPAPKGGIAVYRLNTSARTASVEVSFTNM